MSASATYAAAIRSYFSSTSPSKYERLSAISSHSIYAIWLFARCNSVSGWLARSYEPSTSFRRTGPIRPLRSPIKVAGSHTYR